MRDIHHYIDAKEIVIEYIPTADMLADIMRKPLHGALFDKLCAPYRAANTSHNNNNTFDEMR